MANYYLKSNPNECAVRVCPTRAIKNSRSCNVRCGLQLLNVDVCSCSVHLYNNNNNEFVTEHDNDQRELHT